VTPIEPAAIPSSAAPGGAKAEAKTPERAAKEFEAAFVSEMLKHSGVGRAVAFDSGFGGEAMASFLVEEIGRLIAERGGFGVAELIKRELESRQ
jgi:Rod binding domain-containing protein